MNAIIRIILRYFAGIMLAAGYFSEDLADMIIGDDDLVQLVTQIVALAIGVATEVWYWLSKKFGWAT